MTPAYPSLSSSRHTGGRVLASQFSRDPHVVLTAHQPVYLPWLGLFHKIGLADIFCFFDIVQYQPKDWNNRNKVKIRNGQTIWLSIPVLRNGYRDQKYIDLRINNAVPWQRKHWKTLELNYSKAPYYDRYAQGLERFYSTRWERLADLNYEMLLHFMEVLGLTVPVVKASEYQFSGTKSDLVLDMCCKLGAKVYIFGALGRDYANVDSFAANGISVYFQDYRHPTYPQLFGKFASHMSIVDLLFNCGPRSLEIIVSNNVTREQLTFHDEVNAH